MTFPLLLRRLLCCAIGHDVRIKYDRSGGPTPFRCKRCFLWFEDVEGTWRWRSPQ